MKLLKEELIECLTTLKGQAREFGDNNTFMVDININSLNYVIDTTIKELDREQKTGIWEKVSDGYGITDKYFICKCSECGDTVWCYLGSEREWKYCPSCGVKMIHSKEVKICSN